MDSSHLMLARRLEEVLGAPHAETLMSGLTLSPDEEIARRGDVARLERRMDGLEQRMGGLEQRVEALRQDMGQMEERLKVTLSEEIIKQTRFFAVIMAAVVVAALGFVAAVL